MLPMDVVDAWPDGAASAAIELSANAAEDKVSVSTAASRPLVLIANIIPPLKKQNLIFFLKNASPFLSLTEKNFIFFQALSAWSNLYATPRDAGCYIKIDLENKVFIRKYGRIAVILKT